MAISSFETGAYIDVNEAFLSLFQLKKEDVIGKTSMELNIFDTATRQRIKEEYSETKKVKNVDF